MLDVNLFRAEKGGNPDLVRESQRRRFKDEKVVDDVIALDEQWRQSTFRTDNLRKELNKLSKEIGLKMRAKEDATELKAQTAQIKQSIAESELLTKELREKRDATIKGIGNLVHDSVPVSDDDKNNEVVRTWGDPVGATEPGMNHVDLLQRIDGVDYERGSTVAGSRGYFLKGYGVRLNIALIQYAMDFLMQRNYIPLQTPYYMQKEMMAKVAQLEQFDEELYTMGGANATEKYLIATSEQPIAAYHVDNWVDPESLPLKYAGISTCFRKEAGKHGKDEAGIFRVHQFEKVEQFCLTSPDDNASWELHEEMLAAAGDFHQSLGIPYRVVTIVSKELNNAAAKKYDLEGWFPSSKEYRELVSCSNCTDYQSRRLEVNHAALAPICEVYESGRKMTHHPSCRLNMPSLMKLILLLVWLRVSDILGASRRHGLAIRRRTTRTKNMCIC